jgi:hypothetical protein
MTEVDNYLFTTRQMITANVSCVTSTVNTGKSLLKRSKTRYIFMANVILF